jgi:hypothetical protein
MLAAWPGGAGAGRGMSNQQLYFAIGIPIIVYLLGFTTTILIAFWQAKELREDVRGLRTQIELIMGKISDIDTRVAVLEDRAKRS